MISSILWIILLSASVQTSFVSGCEDRIGPRGIIHGHGNSERRCWTIRVPHEKYVRLEMISMTADSQRITVQITETETERGVRTFEKEFDRDLHPHSAVDYSAIAFNDVEIRPIISEHWNPHWQFKLSYKIEDVACLNISSLRCSTHSCVGQSRICDGIKDCGDGRDEINCETGIQGVKGLKQSRLDTITWLKKERTVLGAWRKNAERAITALYLAEGVKFNGSCNEDEGLARELELRTSVALLRNGTDPLTPNQLGMFVHALLVSCHDPRNFYGFDLVQLLKNQVEFFPVGNHPLALLALCNAHETLTDAQVQRLVRALRSDSAHSFLIDVQAVALMALSCVKNSGSHPDEDVDTVISATITRFQELQSTDGSFGNIYTTALVAQALLGSNQEESPQWRIKETVKYFLKQQAKDSSFGDFLVTYLILPILNSKSLVDIGKVDCSLNRRNPRDADPVSDIESRLGPKMYVKYSLYIGDKLDIAHVISLRVPHNVTAHEIMEIAAVADPKYKFESHMVGKKMYVFSISGIANDPEDDKFWILYLNNGTSEVITASPAELRVQDGEHLIMWYKTPSDVASYENVQSLNTTELQ